MPHIRNISRRALKKKGLLNEDDFYRLLAQKCGYIDEEMAKRFYLGMVRAITEQLRADGVSRMPHLGDFALIWQKQKIAFAGKVRTIIPSQRVLKFIPKEAWRKYFSDLKKE